MRREPERTPAAQRAAMLAWSTANALREGRLEEALAACLEALALQEEAGELHSAASVRTTLGLVLHALGRLEEARAVLDRALAVHATSGERRLVGLTLQELAMIDLAEGRVERATARLVDAAEAHSAGADPRFETRALLRLGTVHHAAGRLEEARLHLDLARARGAAVNDPDLEAQALCQLGLVEHEAGRPSRALLALGQALVRAADAPPQTEVGIRLALARVRLERRQLDEAWREATAAAELASHGALRHDAGEAQVLLAAAAALDGRVAEAEDGLAEADVALGDHVIRRELVGLVRGLVDLAKGDRDAAFGRLGAVQGEALVSVSVRLTHRLLRSALGRTSA